MAYVYDDSGEHDELPSRDMVLARLERWRQRLSDLYARIEGWLPETAAAVRGQSLPYQSPLMKAVGIAPVRLPTLTVRWNGGAELRVKPEALWMIGGNGQVRLSIIGGDGVTLVDAGTDDAPDWMVYPRRDPTRRHRFGPEELRHILAEAR
ncbi:hypothetical protein [Rhodocista pekingensis]|uniref:Uncharacterized protein n=1 Tax=Rhodocista pekingensis TaxID=201185 RepID=A0ABW2KT00_9PROT